MPAKKQAIVVKSNRLIEASYRLDLTEQRIILAAIVEARETQKGLSDGFVTLEVERFAHTFGLVGGSVYGQLKDAMLSLYRREVSVRDTHPESGKERVTLMRWVSSASYIDGAGAIQIRFAPEMVPYITRLESEFTPYRLEKIGGMTSVYAVRLYELLVQYLGIGKREIEIAGLKETLALGDDYPRIDNFKSRVIDVAVKQINGHSDIRVSYTQRKTGRAVTHLLFEIARQARAKPAAKPKAGAAPVVDRQYVERHARPGESYDTAYRRLAGDAGAP